jgi:hypothetical protein
VHRDVPRRILSSFEDFEEKVLSANDDLPNRLASRHPAENAPQGEAELPGSEVRQLDVKVDQLLLAMVGSAIPWPRSSRTSHAAREVVRDPPLEEKLAQRPAHTTQLWDEPAAEVVHRDDKEQPDMNEEIAAEFDQTDGKGHGSKSLVDCAGVG